jgi:hypothetical protein
MIAAVATILERAELVYARLRLRSFCVLQIRCT